MTDPIMAEIIRNFLDTAADQVYETICRTSPNPGVNEAKDCGAGIYSYDGEAAKLVSRAGIIAHSFALTTSAQSCLDFFRGDLHPGDALLLGDSYHGGSHLGCWTVVVPIFFNGRPRFLSAGRLHVLDQGGPAPGAANPLCREIWHEGLRLPPLKLYEKGERRRELWDWIESNIRLPDVNRADVEAMIGACRVGEQRIRELVERYGLEKTEQALDWIFSSSERRFREQLRQWPDGEYSSSFHVDTDFADARDLKIQAKVIVAGDEMTIDFTGTDLQTDGLVNSAMPNTMAYISIVMSVLFPDVPVNSGFFEPLTVILPEGTLVNPQEPAPTVLGTIVAGGQIAQAVMKAMEQIVPERVANASIDIAHNYVIGNDDRAQRYLTHSANNPRRYLFWDMAPVTMSASAAYGVDGWGTWATPFSVASPANHEMTELQYPTLYQQAEFALDSAAPGQWRGPPAYVMRRVDVGASETYANFASQSLVYPLPGYAGGYEGAGNFCVIEEGEPDEAICGEYMVAQTYDPSKVIFAQSGGGGGWGDPLDRDPQAVLDDVLDEYVSLEGARADYGVIIDGATWQVKVEETAQERGRRKADTRPRKRRGIGREWTINRAKIAHRVA
ncbi:hydantoinase B/oxoprolinase family protein [Rhizorhabdus histidinilytica]|uniref:N-methylhydantoinase B n=1 Tax=Rhizorhabdus histidinilytica TaxID=439228 RepID=A0A1T5B8E9_9SPHN|nr:hydantoinase B/oxoprolinase family protein [Rhizorhabdus histidinilytica]SKB43445.1 N-methylhydantoinase B [Rhizorhabdus histidinilytica]